MPKSPKQTPGYPAPANPIPNDITPSDQAIYVPAITKNFAQDILRPGAWKRPFPAGVTRGDLNFLDPNNKLFHISHALTSAGLALNQKRDCIITTRDRKHTRIIADSGGYQVAGNKIKIRGDQDRMRILRWQEQRADIAITLDIPTGPLTKPGYRFASFADCLNGTLDHLDFYQRERKSDIIFLNVLQGNDRNQSDIWYDAVKDRFQGEGWAFAGPLRHNMYEVCRRILFMFREGKIQDKKWIHVLGTSRLDTAVLLTALQRAINRHINKDLRISYDTSSPFRVLRFHQAYTTHTFTSKDMTMPNRDAPDGAAFVGRTDLKWIWPSALGNKMTMADFCVPKSAKSKHYCDTQSYHYLAHHNLSALCAGIALANRVFDVESVDHNHTLGHAIGAAAEAIERIIASQSDTELRKAQTIFALIPNSDFDIDSEEERDF